MDRENEAAQPPLWQLLVTEGHVQAARIRAVQPWLISTGMALVVVGALLQFILPAPVGLSRDQLLKQKIDAIYAPAVSAIGGLADVGIQPRDSRKLVPGTEMPTVAAMIEDSLNADGQVSSERVTPTTVDTKTFWRRPWPLFNLISTGNRDLKLVGAIINLTDPDHLAPARWLGIFRRHHGRWQHVSLAGKTFYAPQPSAHFRDIALDLTPLLPPER